MRSSAIIYPSFSLTPYIKYYWILKTDEIDPIKIQTIPSGCIHLVFHRGNNLSFDSKGSQPKNFIRGQLSTAGTLISQGDIDMIAVVFQPLGMIPFFTSSMNELYNRYIDVEDLEDAGLNNLKNFISGEVQTSVCIQQIESFLLKRLSAIDYNYKRIFSSIQLIVNEPEVDVDSLAQNACLGYRHFKRVFTDLVGVSPKEYYRIIRFQRALYTLQNSPHIELTQLAYICGYYDHSHLVKDFKAFSNCSPSQYLSTRIPYSTFFSKDCKLNLIKKR
jgi:Transcriptional regulator containing an amidase domain and an AraC-type DNA-binding HTH domain